MSELQRSINEILTGWNPMEVPEEIVDAEYLDYVDPVIEIGDNESELTSYLTGTLVNRMGLDFDETNPDHMNDVKRVVDRIKEELKSSQA